ncbi:hypothetical protein NVP1285O_74 [Vibrio phage 1.285.O._10N.286.55.C12]|nr:hypothetical protein NVP1285O_74 [Vibrio phage 1.285.O._10N.286.55.C12]
MTQLIEVGTKDKRMVTPLNKELYAFVSDTLYNSANNKDKAWHVGSKDIGDLINELEKRYDITPKQDTPDV